MGCNNLTLWAIWTMTILVICIMVLLAVFMPLFHYNDAVTSSTADNPDIFQIDGPPDLEEAFQREREAIEIGEKQYLLAKEASKYESLSDFKEAMHKDMPTVLENKYISYHDNIDNLTEDFFDKRENTVALYEAFEHTMPMQVGVAGGGSLGAFAVGSALTYYNAGKDPLRKKITQAEGKPQKASKGKPMTEYELRDPKDPDTWPGVPDEEMPEHSKHCEVEGEEHMRLFPADFPQVPNHDGQIEINEGQCRRRLATLERILDKSM